jgi:hypothetical protein
MKIFTIKHTSGLYLKNEYVSYTHKRSAVTLVDNEFPCFTSKEAAQEYMDAGDELFYSFNQDLRKEDLTIVTIKI